MADESHDGLISQFTGITGAPTSIAYQILQASSWDLDEAVRFFFESQDGDHADSEPELDMDEDDTSANAPSQPGRSSQPSRPLNNQSRLRTLRDLQSGSTADDSEDEDDNKQDFFAGGEKSGLAVQNPNNGNENGGGGNHFNSIMNQARQNRPRPGGDDEPPTSSNFSGRAQTLGGDDAPSQTVNDPREPGGGGRSNLPRVTRNLHLWSDGFSVDDGELYRFDDPANAPTLALINQGRAPLALLGVEPGQEVDLQLIPHKDEKYVQPKKKYKPFEGQGQRLGSPTPGPSGTTETAPVTQARTASTGGHIGAAAHAPSVSVDDSQPAVTIQIRLGDGTRLTSRFNTSHTIGDVYDYVSRADPASSGRSWVLMTTFPSKALSDKSAKLEEMSDFKRGGVVVQRWT